MRTKFLTVAALVISACDPLTARAADTPEQTVRDYLVLIQEDGFAAFVALMHPDELVRFKKMIMAVVRKSATKKDVESITTLFGANATLASLEAMPPPEFMATLLKTVGKDLVEFEFSSGEVLGSVREGNVVHVVTRVIVSGPEGVRMRHMDVVSVKPHEKGWRMLLTGSLEVLPQVLSAE